MFPFAIFPRALFAPAIFPEPGTFVATTGGTAGDFPSGSFSGFSLGGGVDFASAANGVVVGDGLTF